MNAGMKKYMEFIPALQALSASFDLTGMKLLMTPIEDPPKIDDARTTIPVMP